MANEWRTMVLTNVLWPAVLIKTALIKTADQDG